MIRSLIRDTRGPWAAFAAFLLIIPATGAGEREERVDFNRQIRPILSNRCFRCHGPDANHRKADLRLDTAEGVKADLGGRQAVVAGKPDDSELIARIIATDDAERMPPPEAGKPLAADEIALLRRWIDEGAEFQVHWSFTPPRRPHVPPVSNTARPSDKTTRSASSPPQTSSLKPQVHVRNDIDRFVLARLERERIAPSAEADRATLIRRVSFDLVGLPPTPAEVEAFVGDPDPRAYETLVERLLSSPRYGERMAMYWLDLVRYADTVGYHGDQEHAISPYRDYVINAFNDNMPFDRFTAEQLAGDLMEGSTVDQKIASGYNRLLQTSHEGGVQVKEYLQKYASDRVRNLGAAWMGATLGCTECHDHKYDPYTQRDYYSLAAIFADVNDLDSFKAGDVTPTKREPEMLVLSPIDRARIEKLEVREQALEKRLATDGKAESGERKADEGDEGELRIQLDTLRQQIELLRKQTRRTMVTVAIEPRASRILARGDWMDETGEIVQPQVPRFLGPLDVADRRVTRLDLARWLTSADHPQTSRVFVNRLWSLFLGNGLCNSLDDTGSQGEWPTHPELVDWLAMEFAEGGDHGSGASGQESLPQASSPKPQAIPWNIKHVVRLIVTSATYRQSSAERPELRDVDPHNRLYARQSAVRLPAEMIRDQALAVSGLLVDRLGGESARPYQPARYYQYLNFPKREYKADSDDNQYRRGVYIHWQRQYLHPMLKAFDAPSREECTARRPTSNTPLAALALLNDPSFVEAARVFAARILREGGSSDMDRIRWAWKTALSRDATADEIGPLLTLLLTNRTTYATSIEAADRLLAVGLAPKPADVDPVELATWTSLARALLNLHETITRY